MARLNLLNHDFESIIVPQYHGAKYYECTKCNHIIYEQVWLNTSVVYINSQTLSIIKDNSKLSLTCEEILIKKLLE